MDVLQAAWRNSIIAPKYTNLYGDFSGPVIHAAAGQLQDNLSVTNGHSSQGGD